jgi:coproporphyrinogen III oxidase-like Fe-S oxidoreductase
MSTITIHLKDKEEETLMESLLKRMKISFEKNEDDFELTDEIKKMIDERLLEDKNTYVDAEESLRKISEKYGI